MVGYLDWQVVLRPLFHTETGKNIQRWSHTKMSVTYVRTVFKATILLNNHVVEKRIKNISVEK